jgi:UDP-N-acetylglucosamine 2-epimerase (non-hydrolysing)
MAIKLICVAGARPNFMKLAPLLRELMQEPAFSVVLVHTGQHYDDRLSGQFFRDLGMPSPDYQLEVGSGSHAAQTAEIMKRFEPVVVTERPDGVLVVGDGISTVACALVAKKLLTSVIHVEAGLRSFDRSMPEEINRVVTDSISDLFLITEESGRSNLLAEGIPAERIRLVGNLMIDSLRSHLDRARDSDVFRRLGGEGEEFGLVTLHRPANVDNPQQFEAILGALEEISSELPLYFPVHPRTRQRLEAAGMRTESQLHLIEPLGYLDFLGLMSQAAVVLTDSGGIQEETTALGVPCLTVRENTERPVTVEQGTNLLAGTSREGILRAWRQIRKAPKSGRVPPLWDGSAARRCREALKEFYRVEARANA